MYDAIVPTQCELFYVSEGDRLQVRLKKKNHGIQWPTFEDKMVCKC